MDTENPLVGRQVHALAYINGAIIDMHPTIYINPDKAAWQLPWTIRHGTQNDQSDEGTDLRNDNPTQLPITLVPLRNRPPLVLCCDMIRTDLHQRLGDSDMYTTNA